MSMKTIQTPFPQLAKAIGLDCELYFKREDLHKYGSHKGRSIPAMIKKYFKDDNITNFVISSSGNAALAAIYAVEAHNKNNPNNIKLTVFVGKKIDPKKLKLLTATINDPNVTLQQVERPKQQAFQVDKSGGAEFLRQSTDDLALQGYYELAEELNKIPNLQAIFIPTSSGTTAQALGEAFANLEQNPQIHVVQTDFCHPIAEEFNGSGMTNASLSQGSIASAIVDKIAHRKDKVISVIKDSHGSGWIVNDEEIKQARQITRETTKIDISPNSALSVAGVKKAIENGWQWDGVVVCLITGR